MKKDARLQLLGIFLAISSVVLLGRLFFWQVLKGSELSTQARFQYQTRDILFAPRGSILAKDSTWLAASEEAYLVFAFKPDIKRTPREIANLLAHFFVEDSQNQQQLLNEAMRIEGLLSREDVVWIPLKRKVSKTVKESIASLNIDGIGFEKEEKRFYPEGSSAANLLGFVGKDKDGNDKGYFGLEGYWDLSLSGKHGFVERESDARGNPILFGETKETPAVGGIDLVTHIDKAVQRVAEEKLQKGIQKYGAKGGLVVVMNPTDGGVMAIAVSPSYDPKTYQKFSDELFRNPAISDSFEPGSIIKPLVMAAALDKKVVDMDTKCDICSGPVKIDRYMIETWDKKYYPDSTMVDIIVHSDNVGMTFVAQKLGADALYDYFKAFGFTEITGIDLQGEANIPLRAKGKWSSIDLATASFGQGIALTPIQIVRAFAAIANGGFLVKPQVVDKIQKGSWSQDLKVEAQHRVLSEETTLKVKEMMVAAVKNGEAKWTATRGFRIAGKTGTAQIPISGHYDEEKTIASFVGFAPADKPKFVMLVTLREPSSSPWGSETAAPLWFDIAKELFFYFGIRPES